MKKGKVVAGSAAIALAVQAGAAVGTGPSASKHVAKNQTKQQTGKAFVGRTVKGSEQPVPFANTSSTAIMVDKQGPAKYPSDSPAHSSQSSGQRTQPANFDNTRTGRRVAPPSNTRDHRASAGLAILVPEATGVEHASEPAIPKRRCDIRKERRKMRREVAMRRAQGTVKRVRAERKRSLTVTRRAARKALQAQREFAETLWQEVLVPEQTAVLS